MEGAEEMSNEVDKRIIEMEFKNEEFEKNAAKTLSTLQSLKQKLNNNFSTKGAEELNAAIKAVDVSPVIKGLETVQVQFNAMQIVGKRVIENLVDSAMKGIADVKNKLTAVVNQIKVGGANRAQNIEQAKFMLEGLNVAWEDIQGDINYGVQDTAYGLDAAAKVASQLVASSVTLGDNMRAALRGVSGVAAMTNSSYEEIGHIFTTVAGQGKLMSMQLNMLAMRGLNVAADLGRAMGKTEAEIRDMVTKGEIDFQTFANAMDELYGQHAAEANKTFSGALSNTKAALSRLGADIQTQKFESFRKILLKVTALLKELKTALKPVEESLKSAMDAVGTLTEFLIERINISAIVDALAPKFIKVTDIVKEFATTAKSYIQKLDESKPSKFIKTLTETADKVEEIVNFTEKEIELAKRIWEVGDLGNGEERVKNIEALGESYERVQSAVDKFIDSGYDWDAVINKTTNDAEKTGEAVDGFIGPIVDTQQKPTAIYLIIDALHNFARILKNVVGSAVNIISVVKDSFKEVFSPSGVAGGIQTFTGILADLTDRLYISRSSVEKFKPLITFIFTAIKNVAKVMLTLAKWGATAATKIITIFNAIRNSKFVTKMLEIIGKCIKVIGENLKIVFNKLKESGVLQKFIDILKVVGMYIGEKLVRAFAFLAEHSGTVFVAIANGFAKIVDWVENLIAKMQSGNGILDTLKNFFLNGVETGGTWLERIGNKLSSLFGSDGDSEDSIFKKAYKKAAAFGKGLIEGLNSITWDDLKSAGGLVAKIYSLITILNLVGSWTAINKGVSKFFKGLTNFFNSLSAISRAATFKTVASSLESLGRTLLMIILSITALTIVLSKSPENAEKAIRYVREIISIMYVMELLVAAVSKSKAVTAKFTPIKIDAKKLALAGILTGIATLFGTFVLFSKQIDKTISANGDKGVAKTISSLTIAIGAFGLVIAITVAAVKSIMKTAGELSGSLVAPELLRSIAKVINSFSKTLIKLMLAITLMTAVISMTDDPAYIIEATLAFAVVVVTVTTMLAVIINAASKLNKKNIDNIEVLTNTMSAISADIAMLMLSLAGLTLVFSKVTGNDIALALATFGAIVVALIGSLFLINKIQVANQKEFNSKINALMKITGMIVLLIGAFAGLTASLAKMKSMGVQMKELVEVLAIMLGAVTILTAIGGIAGLLGGTAGIQAVAMVLGGFGIAMLGTAAAIVSLALALKIIIEVLPNFVSAFESFHNQIMEKRELVVAGIGDFIGVLANGLLVGIIQALNALINNLEPIIEALIDTIIVICNVLGEALKSRAGELGEAIGNLLEGVTRVIVSAVADGIIGIVRGLKDAITDIMKYLGMNDEDYEEHGQWKDAIAESYVARLKSDKISEGQKEEYRKLLAANGYDENGNRVETWELNTKWVTKDNYSVEYESNLEAYNKLYNKSEVSDASKQAEDAKKSSKKTASDWIETAKNSDIASGFADKAMGNFSGIQDKIGDFDLTKTIGDFGDMVPQLNEDSFNTDAIENFKNTLGDEAEETADTTQEYIDVVNEKTNILETAINTMAANISSTLENLSKETKKYGNNVIRGLVEGMTNTASMVLIGNGVKNVSKTILGSFAKELEIHSPSRAMKRLGVFTIQGLANGITESTSLATTATEEAGRATILSMRQVISGLYDEAFNDLDASPRITPIIDLSNVTDGVNSINGMFDMSRSIGLGVTTSGEARASTSRKLNAVYQNGSSFDDTNTISAINSLNNEVSTLKDAINGMQVVIDGRALVGQIATPMDKALGKRALAGRR